MEDLLSIEDMAEMISVPQMTNKEAIAWLNNLITSIGEPQHSSLWHYEKALSEIKDLLGVLPSAEPKTDEENELKFYYVESIDDYWIGQRLDNFYYADWHDGLGFVWSKSRYLPWGEHVVNEQTLWKEHTYPSEPKEIPFTIWIVGFLEKHSADRPIGEWVDNGDRYYRCSLCGTKDTDTWDWCHGCGCRMKGADDE